MSCSDVEVKEELGETEEDCTEDETSLENSENEANEPNRDPLEIAVFKSDVPSDEDHIKTPTRSKVKTEKEIFRCEICKEVYFKRTEFLRHKYSHSYDAKFTCLICHYVFKTKLGIIDHILVFHKNRLEFGCNICHIRFASKEELDRHLQKHANLQDRPFKCGLCSLRFVSKTILNTHKLTHSIKHTIACDICHKQCASIVGLANHRRSHLLVKCDKCPKLFDRNNLNRHRKKAHSIGLFKCDICLETFDDDASLNTHKFNHIGQSIIFECTICRKKFDNIKKRNKHELIHNKEKIYECDRCHKRYQYFSQLQKHYRDHPDHTNKDINRDYKPIECGICHKRYTQLMGLRNHIKTHTNQKDFECDICHKRFYTKYVLRDHLRVHTGEKPFKCKLCPKKFRTGTNLNYHTATHSKEKKFGCAICDKCYARKGKLMEHIRKQHSTININNKVIESKRGKTRYKKKTTISKPRNKIKANIIDDQRFECSICHRRFKLKYSLLLHQSVHENDWQYECDICYVEFEKSAELEKHKKLHKKKVVKSADLAARNEHESNSYTLICNNVMTTIINPLSLQKKKLKS